MNQTIKILAVLAALVAAIAVALTVAVRQAKHLSEDLDRIELKKARPWGMNVDMIYTPGMGNGVCSDEKGRHDSCVADVIVGYADGTKRTGFGVFVGNNLIVTNYEVVTGHETHAVKPEDGHIYVVRLSNGTMRKAQPWAFLPDNIAVLKML